MRFQASSDVARVIRPIIPRGESLAPEAWARRHRGIVILLWAHAGVLPLFGFLMGAEPAHALSEGAIVAAAALLATSRSISARARSIVAVLGLMSSSAMLVHLSGGYIEAHFHFFVMLGVIFLYEDWLPYTLAVAYVAIHHGVAGTLDPLSVFNHPAALERPWVWAGVHALFVLGLSAALIVAWGVVDRARRAQAAALTETQELRRQLHAQEKLAALGTLVAGLAHEVRTPLTVVTTNAALIELHAQRVAPTPESAQRFAMHVREINSSVDRMTALVAQMKRFHRLESEGRATVALEPLVKEALDLYASAHKTSPRLRLDLQPTPPTPVQALGVQQVVINLVNNGVEACGATGGEVVIMTYDDNGRPCLVVSDNGAGMTDAVQSRLFEPLFTTKPEGSGLGLHIVKRIVDDHGGDISWESNPGEGTTFRVHFAPVIPRRQSAPRRHEKAMVGGAPS